MGKTASIKHNPLCKILYSGPDTYSALTPHATAKIRSRASRRQTSPGINADKSLKELSPSRESNILAPRPNAGVSKRKGKTQKSSKQKQRDAKRQDRAEAVMSKMEVKVGLKVKRSKVINERKGEWGVVNGEGREARRLAVIGGAKDEDDWQDVEEGKQEGEEEGGEMEEVVVHDNVVAAPAGAIQPELPVANTGIQDETIDEGDKIT
jgi:hypothetical protein